MNTTTQPKSDYNKALAVFASELKQSCYNISKDIKLDFDVDFDAKKREAFITVAMDRVSTSILGIKRNVSKAKIYFDITFLENNTVKIDLDTRCLAINLNENELAIYDTVTAALIHDKERLYKTLASNIASLGHVQSLILVAIESRIKTIHQKGLLFSEKIRDTFLKDFNLELKQNKDELNFTFSSDSKPMLVVSINDSAKYIKPEETVKIKVRVLYDPKKAEYSDVLREKISGIITNSKTPLLLQAQHIFGVSNGGKVTLNF